VTAVVDALLGQHLAGQRNGGVLLDLDAAAVFHLDRDHR